MTQAATTPYDGIIPTGWLVAYGRTFTDIPHAKEVFTALEALHNPGDAIKFKPSSPLAPHLEARHKLLNKLIRDTKITQVVEVAAGLTTRGLELTEDPSMVYVEFDLPTASADKQKIVDLLVSKSSVPKRPNLHFRGGSAVVEADLLAATESLDPSKPVAVVNEGLLRYLSTTDKATYAKNVASVLKKFGGVWITSDISEPKVSFKGKEILTGRDKKITEVTGKDFAPNIFKDDDEAERFFKEQGFNVERHSFFEVFDELKSPEKLDIPRDYSEAITKPGTAFVMRLRAT